VHAAREESRQQDQGGEAARSLRRAKKRKRLDKCLQEIAAESHVSVERMLEFMTWVASAYDQFNGEALFAVLHAKPVSAGVMPAVVESLASRDIFTRLVVIQVLQQLLYLESNKVALIAKGGISLLLQSLRDLQCIFSTRSRSPLPTLAVGNRGNSSGIQLATIATITITTAATLATAATGSSSNGNKDGSASSSSSGRLPHESATRQCRVRQARRSLQRIYARALCRRARVV
jgi:hypothetical protein